MKNIKDILKDKKMISIILCILLVIGMVIYLYLYDNSYKDIDSIEKLEKDMQNDIEENGTKKDTNNNEIEYLREEKIAIHITGEIKKKGIIYLNKGARIADAIKVAGGETKDANLDQVNLAYVLEDGQKIYIPNKKEKITEGTYIIANTGNNVLLEEGKNNNNEKANKKGASNKVNINSANQTELETLPGIGPSLAQRIIEYRQSNGEFQKIEDIQNVKGIGDSKYGNIKGDICI